VPTWQDLVALLGHADFLLVADSKAAALSTRATIAGGGGRYLVPMPLTGEVPTLLRDWVLRPPLTPEPVVLPPTQDEPTKPREVGLGFEVVRCIEGCSGSLELDTCLDDFSSRRPGGRPPPPARPTRTPLASATQAPNGSAWFDRHRQ
jgi:hypothetical protein